MKLVHKLLTFEVKKVDEASRSFWAVASTEAKDFSGDIMHADGWILDRFLANPVIPWGHDYDQPPVARAIEVKIEASKLMVKIQFPTAEEYAYADTIFRLYKGGYLRAFSVGFNPVEFKNLPDGGREYFKQELLEISCVTLPDNQEALIAGLQKAVEAGEISDEEAKALELRGAEAERKALWGLVSKQADKIKALAAKVEALEQAQNEQPQTDPEALAKAAQASEHVAKLETRLKALEEAQAKQQPEQTIEMKTLAGAIEQQVSKTIGAAVTKAIKYHLGQVD